MAILSITTQQVGTVGVTPSVVYIATNDTESAVLTAGYLNNAVLNGTSFPMPCLAEVSTQASATAAPQVGWYQISYSSPNWSLIPAGNPGDVTLPTIANHIATYTNTTGTLAEDAATAINGGNLQAGLSGTAGYLASFPSTASKGSLRVTAVANTSNTVTTISNAAMGQASVISIPDPAAATANFVVAPAALVSGNIVKASGTSGLLVDAGFALKANTTAAYAGGGTSNAFVATGLAATSIVTASILASTNAVSITKVVPSANTLTVTFSADPGAATTVSWIAITPAV